MFTESTLEGAVAFPVYKWDIGANDVSGSAVPSQVHSILDIITSITQLSTDRNINYGGSHYSESSIDFSTTLKYYYPEFSPYLYEDGLERTSIDYNLFNDNYLDFVFEALGLLGTYTVERDDSVPPEAIAVNIPDRSYSTVTIAYKDYAIDGQVALLRRTHSKSITLTTELPNFDIALVQNRELGPRTKIYNLLETGRGAMTFMINIIASYIILNYHAYAISLFIKLSGFEGNFEKIKEVLSKLGIDGASFEDKILAIKRNTQVIHWICNALKRQLYSNVPTNAYELLLGPDAADQINKNISLKNYVNSCALLKANLSREIIFQYRIVRFTDSTYTQAAGSKIATLSNRQSFALAENGTLCKLDVHSKIMQTEQLYKIPRLIKRKIVVKDGLVKVMTIKNEGEQIIFEYLPVPLDPDDPDSPPPVTQPVENTKVIYKSVSIPTMSWDDVIAISNSIPTIVSQVSESYRYRLNGDCSEEIRQVVSGFNSLLANENIQTISLDYNPMEKGGSLQYSFILSHDTTLDID